MRKVEWARCSAIVLIWAAGAHLAYGRNVLLFIADGLRAGSVDERTAPTMARLRARGVRFDNSHSLYPTLTTANASAFATGHYLGDTGDFANTIYAARPMPPDGTVTPFLENDTTLGAMNEAFGGNYLAEDSLLARARLAGFATAAVGKGGPTAIQDVTARDGVASIVIDAETGRGGIVLAPDVAAALAAAGLPAQAPKFVPAVPFTPGAAVGAGPDMSGTAAGAGRGAPPVQTPALEQQHYFLAAATRVVLPRLKASGKPFVMVFWSRNPDAAQHTSTDSLGRLTPGIDNPTARAGIRNADDCLAALLAQLGELGLASDTDVFVAADHGFSTIWKSSATSFAAAQPSEGKAMGKLPSGFVAIDLAHELHLALFDRLGKAVADPVRPGKALGFGVGILGADPAHPDVVVAANEGSDLIYLPGANAAELAPRIVDALLHQDYTGGLFVDEERLGAIAGTLPLSAINLVGDARTPRPAIVVGFRTFGTGCRDARNCSALIADSALSEGQGTHGSFGRGDTFNFMAAMGPSFKQGFVDRTPVSNADVAPTLARILKIDWTPHGHFGGRVIEESLKKGRAVRAVHREMSSAPGAGGLSTVLEYQEAGGRRYFDAAGIPGRVVGVMRP